MTEIATGRRADGTRGRLASWAARLQRQLSDRMFTEDDASAREHGWTVTKTSGRFGFGARTYRDPRFDQRRAAAFRGEPPSRSGPRWSG
jgi:hypothetical protein